MIFSLAKKNTLIVEDFAEFARSVRAMLHVMGATNVDIVYNAEKALEACKSRKYDIILSDYNLGPKKDGQQLLEELSNDKLLKSNCIFLMLTAENTSAMVMGAIEFQPDGYIAKPFTGNLLKAKLQKSIEKKDALQNINRCIINKNWQQALDNVQSVIEQHPKYKMSCMRIQFLALKKLNLLDQALELVTKIVSHRSIPWAEHGVGEVFYLKNDLDRAKGIFKNMISEYPMALEGYDWLAKIQQELGQPIDAQETLTKAVKKSPKALQRQRDLGSLAEQNNDIEAMTKAYRNAVKCSTNSAFSSADEYIKLTVALSQQLAQDSDVVSDRLINEAELVFELLDKSFSTSSSALFRSSVAHAAFSNASSDKKKEQKYLSIVEKRFEQIDEQISADVSLEVSESLKELGKDKLADEIINEAIQQNIDNTEFMKKASSITSNQDLIQQSKRAGQHNAKAINLFKQKKYTVAIEEFEKAHFLAPTNINIRLNYVQVLLKKAQIESHANQIIQKADKMLVTMPQLVFSDPRFTRYSELNRLVQLMLQKIA